MGFLDFSIAGDRLKLHDHRHRRPVKTRIISEENIFIDRLTEKENIFFRESHCRISESYFIIK